MGGRCCPALSRNKGQNALEKGLVPLVGEKKIYIFKGPGAAPCRAGACCFSLYEFVRAFSVFCREVLPLLCSILSVLLWQQQQQKKKTSIEEAQLETVPTDWTAVCFVVVSTPRSNHDHLEVSHKMELISSQNLAKHSSPQPSFSLVGWASLLP